MFYIGGFECYCWEGFEGTGVFGDCHNIDECSFYEMADGGEGHGLSRIISNNLYETYRRYRVRVYHMVIG